jgi:hypothetical protein
MEPSLITAQIFYFTRDITVKESTSDKGATEEMIRELMDEKMISNQLLGCVKTKQATSGAHVSDKAVSGDSCR